MTSRFVSEEEVAASHHRMGRYRRHPLPRPLLTEETPVVIVEPEVVPLDERDVRQYILAQLARTMGSTAGGDMLRRCRALFTVCERTHRANIPAQGIRIALREWHA